MDSAHPESTGLSCGLSVLVGIFAGLMSCTPARGQADEAGRFGDADVLALRDSAHDASGRFQRVKLVQTGLKYPLIRIEQQIVSDPTTGLDTVTASTEMVADHIIVKLREGKTEPDLAQAVHTLGGSIRRKLYSSGLYLIEVGSAGLDSVPAALGLYKRHDAVIAYADPDLIVDLMTVNHPNDPLYNEEVSPPDGRGQQWGLNNIGQEVPEGSGNFGTPDADINAPEAWAIEVAPGTGVYATGSRDVVVGVIDTGIDYTHPDLENNIWINQEELKTDGGNYPQVLLDVDANASCGDADGLVRAHELLCYARLPESPVNWDFDGSGTTNLADLLTPHQDNFFLNGVDEFPSGLNNEDGNDLPDDLLGWDFGNDDNDPLDGSGISHGTHVAGIIGAEGNNGIGVAGVNWQASLCSIKWTNGGEEGPVSDVIDCINYATNLGVDLTSNSYGVEETQALRDAVEVAGQTGIPFVAAAGNNGWDMDDGNPDHQAYPAAYDLPNIISVAATDFNDLLALILPSSNYGVVSVDLGAPGKLIISTVAGSDYQYLWGTSMACPHVSGACALLKSLEPAMAHDEIKARVLATVDAVTDLADKTVTGGRLNLFTLLDTRDAPVVMRWRSVKYHGGPVSEDLSIPLDHYARPDRAAARRDHQDRGGLRAPGGGDRSARTRSAGPEYWHPLPGDHLVPERG